MRRSLEGSVPRLSMIATGVLLLFWVSFGMPQSRGADEESRLKELQKQLQTDDPQTEAEFTRRLDQARKELERRNQGQLVFGRVEVEGDLDARSVVAQMIIVKGGYFVDAIGQANKPIGFRLNGYETAIVTPKGPGPIEDLGTIKLTRLPAEKLSKARGHLQIESHPTAPRPDELTVTFDIQVDPINTPSNGTEGLSSFYTPITAKVAADGSFSVQDLSPGKYNVWIRSPNCVNFHRNVGLHAGESREMKPIVIDLIRKLDVEYAVSKDGDFNDVEFKKTTLKANDRWRATDETPEYAFDLLINQKGKQLVLDYRYGPCHIHDIGEFQLDDELKIDENELKGKQPQSVPVEEGHVYIVYQPSWKHWILLRTTGVGAFPEAVKN